MIDSGRLLAVVPARGNSKGLVGKNIRPLAGLPLIAHSILLAKMCPEIDRCIVTTDFEEIAQVARRFGGDVPFLRPPELAQSETPMWPVIRHALETIERQEGKPYDYVALLDPTSPTRLPEDVGTACRMLSERPDADGVVAVSKPHYSPIWHSVVARSGWMEDFLPASGRQARRQDVPDVYQINGLLYIWRARFVKARADNWRDSGKHLMLEIPEGRATSIDNLEQFERMQVLVQGGAIKLPWLEKRGAP